MAFDFNAKTTHDLWIEAREFNITISRPTPTTIKLDIVYPKDLAVTDGAVVLLHDRSITPNNYPQDGQRYTASTDWTAPVDEVGGPTVGANVVAFYSTILGNPLPTALSADGTEYTFSVTITNTDPNTIYYGSVHALSNVLQYYPIGVQSYPLEASRIEKDSSSYAGSIPSLAEAPTNPTNGFVYYDKGLGILQYWTGTSWISTRDDNVPTGPIDPGQAGQTYFLTVDATIRIFDGTKWVIATPTNLQFRLPTNTWAPLGKVSSGVYLPTLPDAFGANQPVLPDAPALGDFFFDFTQQRGFYWDGINWTYPTSANSLFSKPPMMPAFITPLRAEGSQLPSPYLGQLFYNTTKKVLNVWNGTTWIQANTDQQGTPISDKVGIGSDGSYEARIRLIKVLKNQLGYPVQCVELKEEQFNIAIDNALDTYRQLCDHAYSQRFIIMTLSEDQQTYYLNSSSDNTDKVVSVHKINRLNILGANSLNWDTNVYFQNFVNQYYTSGYTDMLSIHMVHSLSEDFQRLFAGDMPFIWDEATRELTILRKVARAERIILEVEIERTEQELLLDRWCKQWLQNWALAECKEYLGLIRTKYSSGTPGPSGPINLNGELLLSDARQDMTDLREQLLNYEFGGLIGKGNVSFLMG
jgi:hypothetical protein